MARSASRPRMLRTGVTEAVLRGKLRPACSNRTDDRVPDRLCFSVIYGWLLALLLLGAPPTQAVAAANGVAPGTVHDARDGREARLAGARDGPNLAAAHPGIEDADPPELVARVQRAVPAPGGPSCGPGAFAPPVRAQRLPAAPPTGPPAL